MEDINMKPIIATYITAVRPWSFSASLIPVLLGNVLAYQDARETFSSPLCILTVLCVLGVHSGGNLTNTYYDHKNGVDSHSSDDKTLVMNLLMPQDIFKMSMICYVGGFVMFLTILALSHASSQLLTVLFIIGTFGAFSYTGSFAFKYRALGDIVIMFLFGPLSVISPYAVQTGQLSWLPVLYSIPLVLHTEAILHANNTRDIEDDKKAGIKTLALHLGRDMSYIMSLFLIFVPYICLLVLAIIKSKYFLLNSVTLHIAISLEKKFRNSELQMLPQETAKLNFLFGLLYIVAFLLQ